MKPLEEPWPLAAWPEVPTRVLAGRDDRMFPLDFQRRVARERLNVAIEEIDGGHMVAMSNPTVLADRLEAYRFEVQASGVKVDGERRHRGRAGPADADPC